MLGLRESRPPANHGGRAMHSGPPVRASPSPSRDPRSTLAVTGRGLAHGSTGLPGEAGAGRLGLGQIRPELPTGAAILAFGHEQNRLDFGCLDMILARADEIDTPGWDNLRRASVLLNAYAARYDRNLNPT